MDAERFEDRTDRAAGDDAGAGFRRTDDDATGAEVTLGVVMQRTALAERNAGGNPLVAILWGRDARNLAPLLDSVPRIESAHPSPMVTNSDFFGSRPFSRAARSDCWVLMAGSGRTVTRRRSATTAGSRTTASEN